MKTEEFEKLINTLLTDEAHKLLTSPDFGFDEEDGVMPWDDIFDNRNIDMTNDGKEFRIKVRAELSYEGMVRLTEALNPVVQAVDPEAYFDMVTSSICETFLRCERIKDYDRAEERTETIKGDMIRGLFDSAFCYVENEQDEKHRTCRYVAMIENLDEEKAVKDIKRFAENIKKETCFQDPLCSGGVMDFTYTREDKKIRAKAQLYFYDRFNIINTTERNYIIELDKDFEQEMFTQMGIEKYEYRMEHENVFEDNRGY